jgi:hypothetical protein
MVLVTAELVAGVSLGEPLLCWPEGTVVGVPVAAGDVDEPLAPGAAVEGVLVSAGGATLVGELPVSEAEVVPAAGGAVVVACFVVLGGLVLEAVLQSNEMVGTWTLQVDLGLPGW